MAGTPRAPQWSPMHQPHTLGCVALCPQVKRQYPQFGELAALLEEGVLDRAAKGLWGTSSKPGRFSK